MTELARNDWCLLIDSDDYIYFLNYKSIELFSVAFGVGLNDISDLEIS